MKTRYSKGHAESMTSMGEGYYLGHNRNSGWVVKKSRIYRDRDTLESMQIAIAEGRFFCDKQIPSEEVSVSGTPGEGFIATCKINEAKGGIEIYFNAKPSSRSPDRSEIKWVQVGEVQQVLVQDRQRIRPEGGR